MYDPANFRLDEGVALITGAGAGIGRAIAETFASAGAAVVVTDRDATAANTVGEAVKAAGGRSVGAACDVTREADLEAAVARAVDAFGKLSILVNNAGGGGPKPFDMPMPDMRLAFELNVFSVFRLCQRAAHAVRGRWGHPKRILNGRREPEPAHGGVRGIEGCREPSDAQHRLRPWADECPRERDRARGDPHAGIGACAHPGSRGGNAATYPFETSGRARRYGQCRVVSVLTGSQLDQWPDLDCLYRWCAGT